MVMHLENNIDADQPLQSVCFKVFLFPLYLCMFPKQQILDSPILKEFADDSFICDENSEKFSKWVENTVGKGEIARKLLGKG